MSNLGYLFTGFAAVWTVLGVYIFILGRRQTGLRNQIERLERDLREVE